MFINTFAAKRVCPRPGQCEDYHPDCLSFLLSGLCDQPNPFLEVFNVREVCMRSCGVCNRYVCMQIAFYLFNFFILQLKIPVSKNPLGSYVTKIARKLCLFSSPI